MRTKREKEFLKRKKRCGKRVKGKLSAHPIQVIKKVSCAMCPENMHECRIKKKGSMVSDSGV